MQTNIQSARALIAALDLSTFSDRAVRESRLNKKYAERAEREYRHFLLLVWTNVRLGHKEQVVPTVLADEIWHQHLLFTKDYGKFCQQLVGKMIDHNPGLEKGSAAHTRAVEHTKELSRDSVGSQGFSDNYLMFFDGDSGGGHGKEAGHHDDADGHDGNSDDGAASDGGSSGGSGGGGSGTSDGGGGASCGASCGGGGCGGGGGD